MFEQSFHHYSQQLRVALVKRVNAVPEDEIKSRNMTELADELAATVQLAPVIIDTDENAFQWEPIKSEGGDRQPVKVSVPFQGDRELLAYHGSSHPILNVQVNVGQSALVISTSLSRSDPTSQIENVKLEVKRIADAVKLVETAIGHHNTEMRAIAQQELEIRLASLKKQDDFLDKLGSLVPIKRRDDGTEKIVLPVQRKQIPIIPKPTTAAPKAPAEPEISLAAYDDIIEVITSMVHVFERSPAIFRAMDEEALRTILLVGLNGLYQGRATGETFNGAGKNDILIREGDKNVFIAECLIWEGPEYFRSKIDDQLLKLYATWRDSKLAVLVFNRKRDFSAVVEKMKAVCDGHPQRVRDLPFKHESGFRYVFRRADDPQREMVLTALAFEVPK